MLGFPESYFETEEICGFAVNSMMKRAWAAGLEIYVEVKRICDKYQIPVFADYGTLLGTIRHKGYIPWDDDIDLCMKREDFERFKEIAPSELDDFLVMKCLDNDVEHTNAILRINNGEHICFDKPFLERFHGCPYVVGIDIFPLDYLPKDKEETEIQLKKIRLVLEAIASVPQDPPYDDKVWKLVDSIERMTGETVNRENNLYHELKVIVEKLSAFCKKEEASELCHMIQYVLWGDTNVTKDYYSSAIEMPFENSKINVPVGYEKILISLYGDDYMTPKIAYKTHEQPFYKKQRQSFKEVLEKEFNTSITDEQMDELIWMKTR